MLKLLRERSVMKMASHDQEQQMKACCQSVGWNKKYLYAKNVRRKLMLHNFFIFIANRGYSDLHFVSKGEKPKHNFFFHKTKEKRVEVGPCQS